MDESFGEVIMLILKALGLAMSVSTLILNVLDAAPARTQILLLTLGLLALSISAMEHKEGYRR